MIWWITLIGSSLGLIIILPYMLLLFAKAASEARDMRGMRPLPPVQMTYNSMPSLPITKLTRREYRRIESSKPRAYRAVYL